MLIKLDSLRGYSLDAADGEIGQIMDVYFDDQSWKVRYLVARASGWVEDTRVLLSPQLLGNLDQDRRVIEIGLSKEQVQQSPAAESHKPLSERMQILYAPYYGWPPVYKPEGWEPGRPEDMHLRSGEEVQGYKLVAADGDIGHVDDFLIDDADWSVRYLEVDTRDWLPGKHVLMSTQWITRVEWNDYGVHVDVDRETIKGSPEYMRGSDVTREYEAELCRFYGKEGYWAEEGCPPEV